jgi:hypothetical protein
MAGDPTAFERAWEARVDDYDACIAAHYLARVQPDARSALEWNRRALAHARLVDPERVRGFMPSLHLNVGKALEDAGELEAARAAYLEASACLDALDDDGYGAMVRRGVASGLERSAAAEPMKDGPGAVGPGGVLHVPPL